MRPVMMTALMLVLAVANPAFALFHLMQIEQVIGGVNGDPGAQAIQLRMRDEGENQLQFALLWLWGANAQTLPMLLVNFDAPVPNGGTGDRVLIATPGFCGYLDPPIEPDFVLSSAIPEDRLAAGSMTFQDGGNSVYWRLSWGGDDYEGPTDGAPFNDADGEFGPPRDGPLPAGGLHALRFQGPAEALSTSNLKDYAFTAGPSVWTNNAGESAMLVVPDPCPADVNGDGEVDVEDLVEVILAWGTDDAVADVNSDGAVDVQDLTEVIVTWGACACTGAGTSS